MNIGILATEPARRRSDLLAPSVAAALDAWVGSISPDDLRVAEIDPNLADTRAFCERYDVRLDQSANCVILAASHPRSAPRRSSLVCRVRRARHDESRCQRHRETSPWGQEDFMEYGGITPIGLPADWPILIDAAVVTAGRVIVGSGVRRSKISLPGEALAELPNAAVLQWLGRAS